MLRIYLPTVDFIACAVVVFYMQKCFWGILVSDTDVIIIYIVAGNRRITYFFCRYDLFFTVKIKTSIVCNRLEVFRFLLSCFLWERVPSLQFFFEFFLGSEGKMIKPVANVVLFCYCSERPCHLWWGFFMKEDFLWEVMKLVPSLQNKFPIEKYSILKKKEILLDFPL